MFNSPLQYCKACKQYVTLDQSVEQYAREHGCKGRVLPVQPTSGRTCCSKILEHLQRIARTQPFQLIVAGKAHPRDEGGKQLIETLNRHCRELADVIPMVFLLNYGMAQALDVVSGADVC
jgi:hypothetical protein